MKEEIENPYVHAYGYGTDNYDRAQEGMRLRDYFAAQAMQTVMSETQEMRIATFWDWIKHLMFHLLHFTFLTVKYEKIEGVHEEAVKRAYEYADAMLKQRLL